MLLCKPLFLRSVVFRLPQGGVPAVNLNVSGLKRGLLAVFDCVSECVLSVESGVLGGAAAPPPLWPAPDTPDAAATKRKRPKKVISKKS